jgi:prolyl 4-hydroxylase
MQPAETLARAPGVQKVPTSKLHLFIKRRFLSPEECGRLIALIDANRRPSTIADDVGDPLFRTSETCDMDRNHPDVAALDAKIVELLGLDAANGEPIQGQRYEVGRSSRRTPIISSPAAPTMRHIAPLPANAPGPR